MTTSEEKVVYVTEYKIPDVYFPTLPEFVLKYNVYDNVIYSVTIDWDAWKAIEDYMYQTELGLDALYNYDDVHPK